MSETERIRQEIKNSVVKQGEEAEAYLSALILAGGELDIVRRTLEFISVDGDIATDYCRIVSSVCGAMPDLKVKKPYDGRKKQLYIATLPQVQSENLLSKLGIMDFDSEGNLISIGLGVPQKIGKKDRLLSAYVKGLFLMCGRLFIYDTSCRAELVFLSRNACERIKELLEILGLKTALKYDEKKDSFKIVIKARESVLDFTALLGANQVYFKWFDKLIEQQETNRVLRQANCEAANADKEAMAAVKQMEDINLIKEKGKLASLPKGLREFAEYRLAHPLDSLRQIAINLNISKSGIYHRVRKLAEIAEIIRSER